MVTKYSDFIQLQDFLPVYDILDERSAIWQSFIPTVQFNELLRRSLFDMTSSEASKRKSIWVRGTFGTGKSHASAVVKHLFCDPYEEVAGYMESIKDISLKNQLRAFRKKKRFFSITLKGVEGAYDIPSFVLSLQRTLTEALKNVAPDFIVKSDFSAAVNWIENHRRIFEQEVFPNSEEIQAVYSTPEQVIDALNTCTTSVYMAVEKAVRKHVGSVFEHSSISEWLSEVENEIENRGIANGLIIFWDEFTSVMDTLKSDRINVLQNIAEKSRNNNIFLFLISHRVMTDGNVKKIEDINRMSDRFDDLEYKMDSLSTYLIMRHSFRLSGSYANTLFSEMKCKLLPQLNEVLNFLTYNNQEQKNHIQDLLPIHPYTAFLCSEMSNYIGSSNRSVIKFLHDKNSGFRAFLENENLYGANMLLTADSLWNFFLPSFENDPASTTFTSLYTSYGNKVKAEGEDYFRVFKAILLLNALSPKFKRDHEFMKPNDNVLSLMFSGDRIVYKITDILNWLDKSQIIGRDIFGEFKIRGTLYNPSEIKTQKDKQTALYKTSVSILDYDHDAKESLNDLFKIPESVYRETTVIFLSCEDTEQLIRSKLNKFTGDKPNYVHVAFFFSLTEEERDATRSILRNLSADYPDLVVVLADESFGFTTYNKFIDSLANSQLASIHFNIAESKEHEKFAHAFVTNWIKQLKNNTYSLYFNGESFCEGKVDHLPQLLNNKIAVKIFTKGFETQKYPKDVNLPYGFYTDKNCPSVIQQILQAQTRDQLTIFKGVGQYLRYLFEDGNNTLVTSTGELSEAAKNGNSWLVEICRHMDDCMEKARKTYVDKFSLSEVLSSFLKPPYGMFTSMLNCGAMSYAMRKHKQDLFSPAISQPISDEALSIMITEMFKMWKDGKSDYNKNLLLRFGSPEENQLKDLLIIDIFELQKNINIKSSEIKSFDNAKWYIQEFIKQIAKYPLWVLSYIPHIDTKLKNALTKLIEVLNSDNPSVDTIKTVFKILKLHSQELSMLVTDPKNYEKGFYSFVKQIDRCEIKDEWWNEMLMKIDQLPSEIAFRKESDVKEVIFKFYIDKITPRPTPSSTPNPNQNLGHVAEPQPMDLGSNQSSEIIKEAKEKIKAIHLPNTLWQRTMLDLIEEHPNIAGFFTRVF